MFCALKETKNCYPKSNFFIYLSKSLAGLSYFWLEGLANFVISKIEFMCNKVIDGFLR